MSVQKEKVKKIFSQVFEPFALGLLALVVIIPVITVMNLTPITKQLKNLNILGVTSQDDISVTLVEGKHEIFTNENLNKIEENKFSYSATLNKRASDNYSKPILEIENRSPDVKTISLFGQTLSNTASDIFIKIGEKSYRIQDSTGDTYLQEINVPSGKKIIIYLAIENLSGVQFSEIFDLTIQTSDYNEL